MYLHKKTGIKFQNRKEAKQVLGTNKYSKLMKTGELVFILEDEPTKTD